MKNLLSIICVLLIILITSATTASLITVKPATPKYVITESFWAPSKAVKYIKENTIKGYVLHYASSQKDYTIVVMYKYQ